MMECFFGFCFFFDFGFFGHVLPAPPQLFNGPTMANSCWMWPRSPQHPSHDVSQHPHMACSLRSWLGGGGRSKKSSHLRHKRCEIKIMQIVCFFGAQYSMPGCPARDGCTISGGRRCKQRISNGAGAQRGWGWRLCTLYLFVFACFPDLNLFRSYRETRKASVEYSEYLNIFDVFWCHLLSLLSSWNLIHLGNGIAVQQSCPAKFKDFQCM